MPGSEKTKEYRIGIDARFFGLENKGLGRYTNELLQGIDRLDQEKKQGENSAGVGNLTRRIVYYVFLLPEKYDEFQPRAKNIKKIKAPWRWYSWREQFFFPFLLRKYRLDLVHFLHFNVPVFFYKKDFVVTIHDLTLFHYPTFRNTTLNKFFYLGKLLAYHFLIRRVVKKARRIVAISKFTKKDLQKTLAVPAEKIKVIYEGYDFLPVDRREFSESAGKGDILKKYAIMEGYILYVGNAYPHKNLERLLLAWQRFGEAGLVGKRKLLLVGKNDYFYDKLKKFVAERGIKKVIISNQVSDEELDSLYRRADLFVFPSLYEGFGLPPLEALARGVPVISSDSGSLPEILGKNVLYFKAESVNSIFEALKKGLEKASHEKGKMSLSGKYFLQKKKYSWRKMAKKTIALYEEVLKEKEK